MSEATNIPDADRVLGSAVRYLIDIGDRSTATLLLCCELSIDELMRYDESDSLMAKITLRCPQEILQFLRDSYFVIPDVVADLYGKDLELFQSMAEKQQDESPACTSEKRLLEHVHRTIGHAIRSVMPGTIDRCEITYRAQLVGSSTDWRAELAGIARGQSVHNQAVDAERVVVWMNHRFRSTSEKRIAEALEKHKVLFFPNCRARLGFTNRLNREPDFLICHEGRWGILEVDGPHHTRAADDHERDRLFKAHGISFVEHFDAGECFERAETVVKQFLHVLKTAKP